MDVYTQGRTTALGAVSHTSPEVVICRKKNRFFYECLTKKVLNRNSAPINKELIDFPKGEDKITSICFMISDGEVPPDVVPTAYCHSKSLITHTH